MSTCLIATQLDAVIFEAFPDDRFSHAVLRRYLGHTYGLIEFAKLVCWRIEVATTAADAPWDTEFNEPLSDGLWTNSEH
jgi:hypothetical protein